MKEENFEAYSLLELFRKGKIDTDFEVTDQYVIGICFLYPERSCQDHEFMGREKSIVELEGRKLSTCVQEAKDLAYQSAVSRLFGLSMPRKISEEESSAKLSIREHPTALPDQDSMQKTELITPPAEEPLESDLPQSVEPHEEIREEPKEVPSMNGSTQIGFGDLRPASSLLKQEETPLSSKDPYDPEEEETEMEKALATPITILGKANLCNGWLAGKILKEHPEIIVDFAHRYSGPKEDQKQALRTLYSEALRRLDRAA